MLASHAKRLLLGLVLAAAGCAFSPGLESGDECEADDDCKARGECVCLEGRCVPAEPGGSCTLPDNCGLGETNCDGDCVDLDSDPAHCGACYKECDPGEDCTGGDCRCGGQPACAPGLTCCAESCVDLSANPAHCGSCGAACDEPPAATCEGDTRVQYPARGECSDGECDYPPSYQDCPGGCAGGVCEGDPCSGRCEDDEECIEGQCRCGGLGGPCPDGLICCADQCVDAAHSLAHCGGCGRDCSQLLGHAQEISCDGGTCYHGSCYAGWTSCTPPAAEDGCETHPWIDLDHCGGCGNECVAGQICARGNCVALDEDNQRQIACGMDDTICSGLEQCCRSIDQARCVGRDDASGCPHGVLLDCDDATDCPEDHACCLDHMQMVATCTSGGCPGGDARLCATDEDCPDGQSCHTSAVDIGPVAISLGHCQYVH